MALKIRNVKMPELKQEVVKIAVQHENHPGLLVQFNQNKRLSDIIQTLCYEVGVTEPEIYALKFSDNEATHSRQFITENNRSAIKNGSVLHLVHAPAKTAQDIVNTLSKFLSKSDTNYSSTPLKTLSQLSSDFTFATEYINKDGLNLLIDVVENGNFSGDFLSFTLFSFVELMDHGIVSWEILQPTFVSKVINCIENAKQSQDASLLQYALSLLESYISNSTSPIEVVENELLFQNLIPHLENGNKEIQKNALSLINALLSKSDIKKKKYASLLSSRATRNLILNHILKGNPKPGSEMAHQLYVLQTLLLNMLEERMRTKLDPQDQESHEKIKELRRVAFDLDSDVVQTKEQSFKKPSGFAKDYKKLGFKNDINPALDFLDIPPGMLALDNMYYFAKHHADQYVKVVLENSCRSDEHECPFGRTSIELTKLLCEILKIGEPPNDQTQQFYGMFFTDDQPFEELFCICIDLLNKTWKEMRATTEDFVKVFSVVKEQITRALQCSPESFDKFKSRLALLTYSEITNIWQQERTSREEWESQAKPIVELRNKVTPEIMGLIQCQRLNYLKEGSRFMKYSSRGQGMIFQRIKDKFWYCRLSLNHKVLHYGDCDEKDIPALEDLPNKVSISDIRTLVTGKECPHMKDVRTSKKSTHLLAFSILMDSGQTASLDFVAPDDEAFNYWTDGINALLGRPMVSSLAKADLETLLSLDIKLRLLEIEGLEIPQEPPPIPNMPSSFDFCFDFK